MASLEPVLHEVFEYLEPSLPHAFSARGENKDTTKLYATLSASSLVCRAWRWSAQVALLRCVNWVQANRRCHAFHLAERLDVFLDTIQRRHNSAATRTRAGHAFPAHLLYHFNCEMLQEVLALCPNLSALILKTDFLEEYLKAFGVYPSIRLFGHSNWTYETNVLSAINRCFPAVVELQLLNLRSPLSSDGHSVHLGMLRRLHIKNADPDIMEQLAACCTSNVEELRFGRLGSLDAPVLPFRSTLRILDIYRFSPAQSSGMWAMDILTDFEELRHVRMRQVPMKVFPFALPPKLETLEMDIAAFTNYISNVQHALETCSTLTSLVALYDSSRGEFPAVAARKGLRHSVIPYTIRTMQNLCLDVVTFPHRTHANAIYAGRRWRLAAN